MAITFLSNTNVNSRSVPVYRKKGVEYDESRGARCATDRRVDNQIVTYSKNGRLMVANVRLLNEIPQGPIDGRRRDLPVKLFLGRREHGRQESGVSGRYPLLSPVSLSVRPSFLPRCLTLFRHTSSTQMTWCHTRGVTLVTLLHLFFHSFRDSFYDYLYYYKERIRRTNPRLLEVSTLHRTWEDDPLKYFRPVVDVSLHLFVTFVPDVRTGPSEP